MDRAVSPSAGQTDLPAPPPPATPLAIFSPANSTDHPATPLFREVPELTSTVASGNGKPRQHPQPRDRRARRSRQDHAGRRTAVAVGRLPRQPGRRRPGHGLDGPRAREGDHDPRQEHRRAPRRHQAQHHRHPGSRGLRRRGRARPDDGRRRAAAGRRLRGAAAADALRTAQGARGATAGDPRDQQDRQARRPHQRGDRRGL